MITSKGEAEAVARTEAQAARVREQARAEMWAGAWWETRGLLQVTLLAWGCLVVGVTYRFIWHRVYLVYHYGWARVRDEGLSVLEWNALREHLIISNGERLRVWEMERDLCVFAPWLAIMAVTAPLIWLVWRLLQRPAQDTLVRRRVG